MRHKVAQMLSTLKQKYYTVKYKAVIALSVYPLFQLLYSLMLLIEMIDVLIINTLSQRSLFNYLRLLRNKSQPQYNVLTTN